jgi:hypothetical protein
MNLKRTLIVVSGVCVLIGAALIAGGTRLTADVLVVDAGATFDLTSTTPSLNLQCGVKVGNGLAQCGSQASSCKNCHEVKGEDPVNTQGDWHIQHAFGDFCEFCHGGNVQAPDKEAAHQGLIEPLGDVKTNCASCHEAYEPMAQTYAAALGVTIGTSSGGSGAPPADTSGPSEPAPTPKPATDSAPSGSEIVDYVAQYQSGGAAPISAGNLIVGGLLAVTIIGGGAFAYWNEKRLRAAKGALQTPSGRPDATKAPAAAVSADLPVEATGELSPELVKLLPTLLALDPRTLRALKIILSDRKRGEEMLQSLSLVNFAVLDEMKRLDKRELSLLLALAAES